MDRKFDDLFTHVFAAICEINGSFGNLLCFGNLSAEQIRFAQVPCANGGSVEVILSLRNGKALLKRLYRVAEPP